ncbi:MAG: glycosyltransferase [Bacteroidota bacterium]|nr:glycosyltransferase [Bacteroidota bacterium]
MNQPLEENLQGKPFLPGRSTRILVAPLDWGLGHATRCIPIIRELLVQGCDVWLAAEGAQLVLLKAEFPWVPLLDLPGYRIRYAKTGRGLAWKMIQQLLKLRRAIQNEHRWLKKAVVEHGFDAVISDNRYGLYHTIIPSVFITHQLLIKTSAGDWAEKILQKSNYRYINKFSTCWVPDIKGANNLAGDLSHPKIKPAIPVRYIGLLSRLEDKKGEEKKDHLLIILSGPEPQRTLLEEKIITEISHYNGTATIVRGLPGVSSLIPSTNMIKFYNHLSAAELNIAMEEAAFVISRSGYSTVMDCMTLKKKTILVPTPGQTEQEYLGNYLMKKGLVISVEQKDFSLNKALAMAAAHTYQTPVLNDHAELSKTIEQFLLQVFRVK